MEVMEVDPLFLEETGSDKPEMKMKLKKILFDFPIKDQRDYINSVLYLGIFGRGKQKKAHLLNQSKMDLEVRYFESKKTQKELYAEVEKFMRGEYHKWKKSYLPSDFFGEFFS